MTDIQYNPHTVIELLVEQVATLTRDNAILVAALRYQEDRPAPLPPVEE